jgi:hypothetical protein
VLLGLWTGGYGGAGALAAAAVGFGWAIACRPRSRLARALAEPWLIAALLLAASCSAALGAELFAHGVGGALVTALSGLIPELACLAILGRVIAVLAAPPAAAVLAGPPAAAVLAGPPAADAPALEPPYPASPNL